MCANLGIRLLHARPYHAWSKGKVERLIRTIQGDFEATLNLLARAAWIAAAKAAATEVQPAHIHTALRQVPAAKAKIIRA